MILVYSQHGNVETNPRHFNIKILKIQLNPAIMKSHEYEIPTGTKYFQIPGKCPQKPI